MTGAERSLLVQRLSDMAEMHERVEEKDRAADDAGALYTAMGREDVLCADLLRETIQVLSA